MNIMIKFFCFLLILGLAGLFVLKKPNGSPWLTVDDFIPDTQGISRTIQSFLNKAKSTQVSTEETSNTQTTSDSGVYRWKDTNDQWQYSDTPPEGKQAEAMHVSGNLNRDLAEEYIPPEEEENTTITTTDPTAGNSVLPASLSPEKISTLMKDTKNIQKIMDDRASQIDKQLQ